MKHVVFLTLCVIMLCIEVKAQPVQLTENKGYAFPLHSFGVSFQESVLFPTKIKNKMGSLKPNQEICNNHELAVQYSCLFRNHFGFTLELLFGSYRRLATFQLSAFGAEDIDTEAGDFYFGFRPEIAYFRPVHKNVSLQAEFGLTFMPFIHDPSCFMDRFTWINRANQEIVSMKINGMSYFCPDATISLTCLFHGNKRPKNHFSVGIYANLSFVTRLEMTYDTFNYGNLPFEARSYGICRWNSSNVGVSVGYRFMGLQP